jgi:hypothetical protein
LRQLNAFFIVGIDDELHLFGSKGKTGSNLIDVIDGGTLLLFCNFGGETDEIEHLMEEALGGCHAHLSSHLYVDGIVHLASQRRPLHVDYPDCFYALPPLAVSHDADEIFGFAGLTDQHYCLVLCDI